MRSDPDRGVGDGDPPAAREWTESIDNRVRLRVDPYRESVFGPAHPHRVRDAATSPPDIALDDTVIVAVTVFVAGFTRDTVALEGLMTHTASGPTVRKLALGPTLIVAMTWPEAGSSRTSCPGAAIDTHTAPRPARTAVAPSGAGSVRATVFVPGSTASSCRGLPVVSSHTAPSPAPTEDSAGSRAGIGISAVEAPSPRRSGPAR